jgi:hypothetical protein
LCDDHSNQATLLFTRFSSPAELANLAILGNKLPFYEGDSRPLTQADGWLFTG